MFYYERIPIGERHNVATSDYFDKRIATNLLYGLETEFSVIPYPVPKGNLGLRRYQFLTYPLRIAHYAIGLHLMAVTQDLLHQYAGAKSRITAEYGGRLLFDEATGQLHQNYESVWYKPHYQKFRKEVRAELKAELGHKVVIRLDIQNYFEEIDVARLLSLIADYIKPSIAQSLNFDAVTRSEIAIFCEFLANKRAGIPQADNDIISAFIGYLFLVFADYRIDDLLIQNSSLLSAHHVYRYMDDIYVVLKFRPDVSGLERETLVSELGPKLSAYCAIIATSRNMSSEKLLTEIVGVEQMSGHRRA